MAEPQLTVALTFDHDGISSEVSRGGGPVLISRGEFGPRVGVPRILRLLDRHRIPATFFVPAHTAVTFRESVAAIVAAGHEIGCHGWAHEDLAQLSEADEQDVMERSAAEIERAAGRRPAGFRAPYWSLSERTLDIALALGFAYDSSLMADDVHLYRVRTGDRHDVQPFRPELCRQPPTQESRRPEQKYLHSRAPRCASYAFRYCSFVMHMRM